MIARCLSELETMGRESGKSNSTNLRKQISDAITMGAADW